MLYILLTSCTPDTRSPAITDTGPPNTPPTAPTITLNTAPIASVTDLRCAVSAPAVDPDDDPITYDFAWSVDGVSWSEASDEGTTSVVAAASLQGGQQWRCVVTPADARSEGAPAEATATVREAQGPLGEELVIDGGFEDDTLSAWTIAEGTVCSWLGTGALDWLDPYSGSGYLFGSISQSEDCRIEQEIDLLAMGFEEEVIDAEVLLLQGQVWLGELSMDGTFDDWSKLEVRLLDENGGELSRLLTRSGATDGWQERGLSGVLPAGTRTIVVALIGTWRQSGGTESHADDVSLSVDLITPFSPEIIKQPMLQDYRTDGMFILWETDSNLTTHRIIYGPAGADLDRQSTDIETRQISSTHFLHVAELTDLEAGTAYDYAAVSGQTVSPTHRFTTAPPAGVPFTVAWVGDNHQGVDTFSQHISHISAQQPDLFISAGDIVNYDPNTQKEGELKEWEEYWFLPLQTEDFSQTTPILFARGNHEKHYEMGYSYSQLPNNGAWYGFPYGDAWILVLDSQAPVLEQQEYIAELLASEEAQAAQWRIVTFHMAPYSNATKEGEDGDGISYFRESWVPIFEEYGVDLVVTAHFHSYQRGSQGGITYTIVGGGGGLMDTTLEDVWGFFDVYEHTYHYALMEVDGSTLTWTAYNLDDEVFDTFTLTR